MHQMALNHPQSFEHIPIYENELMENEAVRLSEVIMNVRLP